MVDFVQKVATSSFDAYLGVSFYLDRVVIQSGAKSGDGKVLGDTHQDTFDYYFN